LVGRAVADIDTILERRTVVIKHDSADGSAPAERQPSLFSKASFSASNSAQQSELDIDDPDFWIKWARGANLDMDSLILDENDDLILNEPRQRKCVWTGSPPCRRRHTSVAGRSRSGEPPPIHCPPPPGLRAVQRLHMENATITDDESEEDEGTFAAGAWHAATWATAYADRFGFCGRRCCPPDTKIDRRSKADAGIWSAAERLRFERCRERAAGDIAWPGPAANVGRPLCATPPSARSVSKLNQFGFGNWNEILERGRFPRRTVNDIAAVALDVIQFCYEFGLAPEDASYAERPACGDPAQRRPRP